MARKTKAQASTQNPAITTLPKKQKRVLALIALTSVVTILLAFVIGAYSLVNYRYEVTPKGEAVETVFEVPRGSGLSSIATRLEDDGLIKSAFIFKIVTKLRGNEGNFKAGEFVISQPASMRKVYDILAEGKTVLYPFTAPEGLTSAQIIRAMNTVETLTGEVADIPAEGTMLPETYMTPKVAGGFINRLRKGMRLQTDPTIIYGISKGEPLYNKRGQRRTLYRSEIDRKTPWNTYQIDGLPPTPICNPGAEAIAAVLRPAQTDYLFFVADGTGGHVFAKTNREHVNNVKKWRKIERQRQRQQRGE